MIVMHSWFLIYSKPRNEDIVSQKLCDAGFEVLNPKLKERKYVRRKLQDVVSPLFPCYIFVKFDFPGDFRTIKYTRGVRSIVGSGNVPSTVPNEIVDSITNNMEDGLIKRNQPELKKGEKVIIKEGPFEGFEAVFEKNLKGTERVTVLLNAINARVIVDGALLAKR